jgi:hypothetical protein
MINQLPDGEASDAVPLTTEQAKLRQMQLDAVGESPFPLNLEDLDRTQFIDVLLAAQGVARWHGLAGVRIDQTIERGLQQSQEASRAEFVRGSIRQILAKSRHDDLEERLSKLWLQMVSLLSDRRTETFRYLLLTALRNSTAFATVRKVFEDPFLGDGIGSGNLAKLASPSPSSALPELRAFLDRTMGRREPERTNALLLGMLAIGQAFHLDARGQDTNGRGIRTTAFDTLLEDFERARGTFDRASQDALREGLRVTLKRLPEGDRNQARQAGITRLWAPS